ncbi:hypothetical protein BP5796_08169 [Coleophoma crateriformis]|uniref:Lariat debranching enzyme C-terminal domain-containing protein n=1 Tax=Coleophoma crateriformis TaxID=565419 RepID=A0A3D8RDM2_9HELO|nr:hypothetical protein BP5796_08169 [Coleophoma crateriformis]
MDPSLQEIHGLRIAVEGCGHGTLNAIYAAVEKACEARGWDGVDLLIIGGDFQAVRNASDLTVMSCPVKFRAIGDFQAYYSGSAVAPYLTIFVGGNHEASSHMWELYYGGWAAPNIYYMGAANVVRVGGVRIAGLSGIWKGYNYNKHHHERLPYNQDDIKSIYHVRELDVRKLLQIKSQVDIGISHDWPRAIEKHGDQRHLFRMKPDFEQESKDGTLGSLAAAYVMDRLRPPYWFAAHLHCKFAATKIYQHDIENPLPQSNGQKHDTPVVESTSLPPPAPNEDEIDLDMDDEEDTPAPAVDFSGDTKLATAQATVVETAKQTQSSVSSDLRAQLPAAFARPAQSSAKRVQPGQPTPPEITNKTVRFLALDKCLPGRKFLQLMEAQPYADSTEASVPQPASRPKVKFQYDPEWLAITRVFASELVLGDKSAPAAPELGEEHYRPLIEQELQWVQENVVKQDKLIIPENFELTAPIWHLGMPEIISEGPREYTNPQTQQFCGLVGIKNKFHASEEEREARMKAGPALEEPRRDGGFGGRGRGGRHGGRGRGRGGRGGRGRGRGW